MLAGPVETGADGSIRGLTSGRLAQNMASALAVAAPEFTQSSKKNPKVTSGKARQGTWFPKKGKKATSIFGDSPQTQRQESRFSNSTSTRMQTPQAARKAYKERLKKKKDSEGGLRRYLCCWLPNQKASTGFGGGMRRASSQEPEPEGPENLYLALDGELPGSKSLL